MNATTSDDGPLEFYVSKTLRTSWFPQSAEQEHVESDDTNFSSMPSIFHGDIVCSTRSCQIP